MPPPAGASSGHRQDGGAGRPSHGARLRGRVGEERLRRLPRAGAEAAVFGFVTFVVLAIAHSPFAAPLAVVVAIATALGVLAAPIGRADGGDRDQPGAAPTRDADDGERGIDAD